MQEKKYYVVAGGMKLPQRSELPVPANLIARCLKQGVNCLDDGPLIKDNFVLFTDKQAAEEYSHNQTLIIKQGQTSEILYPIFEVTLDAASSAALLLPGQGNRKDELTTQDADHLKRLKNNLKIVAIDLPGYLPKKNHSPSNLENLCYFPKTIVEEAERPFFDKDFFLWFGLTFWTLFIPIIYGIYRWHKAHHAKEVLNNPLAMFPYLLARLNGEEAQYKPMNSRKRLPEEERHQSKGWKIIGITQPDHTNNKVTGSYMLEIMMKPPQDIPGTTFFIPVCKENASIIRQMITANYCSYFKFEDGELTSAGALVSSELDKIASHLASSSMKDEENSWSFNQSYKNEDTLQFPVPSLAKTKIATPVYYQKIFSEAVNNKEEQLNKLYKCLWIRGVGGKMQYQPIRSNHLAFKEPNRWKKATDNDTEFLNHNSEIINPVTNKPMLEITFRPGGRSTAAHYIAVCQENSDIIKLMMEINCLGIFKDKSGNSTMIKKQVETELNEIESNLNSNLLVKKSNS